MNRLLTAALLSCAAASLSSPAWSFQGFDFFQQIEQSIQCVRKPGTDMLVCSNKFVPVDDEEEETTPEPVVEPTPVPVGSKRKILFSVSAGGKIVDRSDPDSSVGISHSLTVSLCVKSELEDGLQDDP
jgi:hypothetical protein